jgi:peptidoglycan biosynthesis protein MviN/MurJ (putative lipid II flippase)
MALNVGLNLALVWPMAEAGLALSTSLAAMVQIAILLPLFSRHVGYLAWSDVGRTAVRTLAATACITAKTSRN